MLAVQMDLLDAIGRIDDMAVTWNHVVDLVWVVNRIAVLAVFILVLATGWGSIRYGRLRRLFRERSYPSLVAYGWVLAVLWLVIQLPGNFYQHAKYPAPDADSFGEWLTGQVGLLLPVMLSIAVLAWLPYRLMRWSPRRWWLWLGAVSAPALLAVFVLQPVWTVRASGLRPLQDTSLSAEIRSLAAQCGVAHPEVVVGGDDTHVVGLGGASAIVLQSDLQKVEDPAQIRFTIAHELKHYVEGDNWKAWAISVALVLLIGGTFHFAGRPLAKRWKRQFGFDEIGDPRSLPLLAVCTVLVWTAVLPLFLSYNRHIERDADRFGLALSGERHAAVTLFRSWTDKLALPDTDTFGRLIRANHPSTSERIRMAETFEPSEGDLPESCVAGKAPPSGLGSINQPTANAPSSP
ncbi:MAG: M48 family metalloprotease [Luteibacter sp.]